MNFKREETAWPGATTENLLSGWFLVASKSNEKIIDVFDITIYYNMRLKLRSTLFDKFVAILGQSSSL